MLIIHYAFLAYVYVVVIDTVYTSSYRSVPLSHFSSETEKKMDQNLFSPKSLLLVAIYLVILLFHCIGIKILEQNGALLQ